MELNEYFWKHGYAVVDNFVADPQELDDVPDDLFVEKHISWRYDGSLKGVFKDELQVKGSYSRNNSYYKQTRMFFVSA